MKKLMNFFVLVMVIFFLFSCVNKRVSTTSSQKSYKPKETRLLTADMDDPLRISFPSSLVMWGNQTKREKGKSLKKGTITWGWADHYHKYIIDFIKTDEKIKQGGDVRHLDNSHFGLIKKRYKNFLKRKKIKDITVNGRAEYRKGFIVEGVSYVGLSSIIKYKKGIPAERLTTLLFRNVSGYICKLSLIKKDYADTVDLIEELKKYARIDYNYISQN